ncbi:MAG: SDR family NAD(P)-dependent oxidoreductase, partial [Deltaproteobacteria bacterium]|nr:SDR family NAD(P)-dependent oxidoreductase [Deltaproteobacteria bacterium]
MTTYNLDDNAIAVVGLSCRFPGASDYQKFWDNLCRGVVSVSFFSDEELLGEGVSDELISDGNYVKAGYVLDNIEMFDAAFFGYAGSEAQTIDPQQRLFLECAFEAMEDAGYSPLRGDGPSRLVGVFAGSSLSSYYSHIFHGLKSGGLAEAFQSLVGNDKDYLCSRVSYKLNLRGPSVGVQCACSSSLAAVHQGCESLRNGACDMVIAGGASIRVPQRAGYLYQESMIMSPDAYCRPFDAAAGGTVFSSGVGVVILKRLAEALADRDHIYAVIRSSVINNDGAAKVGYTAPGAEGQSAVILEALSLAGIEASSLGYIETHGTGTAIGDPIEFSALTKVFSRYRSSDQKCALGALKANIGHADVASGIAGFIKAVLAVYYGQLPPNPLFQRVNSAINLEESNFYINRELIEWTDNNLPRLAGVSSFGIGGSNAHVIIQEAPSQASRKLYKPESDLFVLASRNEAMLRELAGRFADSLETSPPILSDLCFTVRSSRADDLERLAVSVGTVSELKGILSDFAKGSNPENLMLGRLSSDGKSGNLLKKPMNDSRLNTIGRMYVVGQNEAIGDLQTKALEREARRVITPPTPFQRRRFWYEPTIKTTSMTQGTTIKHAIWKNRLQTAYGQVIYGGFLSGVRLAVLRQHRINQQPIAPASFYIELIRAGASLEKEGFSLLDLTIYERWLLDSDEYKLQLVINSDWPKSAELFVLMDNQRVESWKRLARALISEAPYQSSQETAELNLNLLRREINNLTDKVAYYQSFESLGISYGPNFKPIEELSQAKDRALARIVGTLGSNDDYGWSPDLLDGALQTVMAALIDRAPIARLFVPVGCRRITLLDKAPEAFWSLAEVNEPPDANSPRFSMDLTFLADDGQFLGKITGLTMGAWRDEVGNDEAQKDSPKGSQRDSQEYSPKDRPIDAPEKNLYRVVWEDCGAIDKESLSQKFEGYYLILAQKALGQRLASYLSKDNALSFVCPELNDETFRDISLDLAKSGGPSITILYLLSLGLNETHSWDEIYSRTVLGLLGVVQKFKQTNRAVKLVIATNRATGPLDIGLYNPAQALLWGLGPVIDCELNYDVRLIDLDFESEIDNLDDFLSELKVNHGEPRVCLRQGRKLVARLDKMPLDKIPIDKSPLENIEELPKVKKPSLSYALSQDQAGLDNLILRPSPRLKPGPGQIAVEMAASSLNFRDVLMAMGIYPGKVTEAGSDGAGVVVAVGDGVQDFSLGSKVIVSAFGCLSSYLVVDSHLARKMPDNLTFTQAASLPVAYITAWYALKHLANLSKGQTILIHAASGGVGLAAVSLAKNCGATILATAGSPEKRKYLASLGITEVFDSRTTDFAKEVLDRTSGQGVDVVLNSLAGPGQEASYALVKDQGAFIELGMSGLSQGLKILGRRCRYHTVNLADLGEENPQLLSSVFTSVIAELSCGQLMIPPITTFLMEDYPKAYRLMLSANHIGKIVLTWPEAAKLESSKIEESKTTSIISGGLGGLGLALMERRVSEGAKHILLISRRKANVSEEDIINQARQRGAEVELIVADITDFKALKQAYDKACSTMPVVSKVFHLASVLDDDLITRLDYQRFIKVLDPKVKGAWNLYRLTSHLNLDEFVMFSSTASLFGPPGQGNYAAANAFLDTFAGYLRQKGCQSLSVNWGAFSGAGMVSKLNISESLSRFGIKPWPLKQGLELLDKLSQSGQSNVVATIIDWPKYLSSLQKDKTHFYQRLGSVSLPFSQSQAFSQKQEDLTSSKMSQFNKVSSEARQKIVIDRLTAKVADILKVEPSELSFEANLIQMGIDSLLALDLFQSLQKDFGLRLEQSLLFENPTLNSLSQKLTELIESGLSQSKESFKAILPDKANQNEPFRLMEMQQAYWVGRTGAVELGNVACHVYLETEMENLNLESFSLAWRKLIERHGMLRAEILPNGSQHIIPQAPIFKIGQHDLRDLTSEEAESKILELRENMSHEVLRPESFPLFKVDISILSENLYRLHLGLDLLIADLHSMNIIMGDLSRLYLDPNASLAPLSLSFRDYVLAFETYKESEAYLDDKAYWLERLDSLPPAP